MKRVRAASLAERDLDEIWYYVAKNSGSIDAENGAVDAITGAFPLFAEHRRREQDATELRMGSAASRQEHTFIHYRENGPYVIISRVIHGMRDQNTAYQQPDPTNS